jgi:hypothetical protein
LERNKDAKKRGENAILGIRMKFSKQISKKVVEHEPQGLHFVLLVRLLLPVVVGAGPLVLLVPLRIFRRGRLPSFASSSSSSSSSSPSTTSASFASAPTAATSTTSASSTAAAAAASTTAAATTSSSSAFTATAAAASPSPRARILLSLLLILAPLHFLLLPLLPLVPSAATSPLTAACLVHIQDVTVNLSLHVFQPRRGHPLHSHTARRQPTSKHTDRTLQAQPASQPASKQARPGGMHARDRRR